MTELERGQICRDCSLIACVEDMPLLRPQCRLIQREAQERGEAQKRYEATPEARKRRRIRQAQYNQTGHRKELNRWYNGNFAAQVARMKRRLRNG